MNCVKIFFFLEKKQRKSSIFTIIHNFLGLNRVCFFLSTTTKKTLKINDVVVVGQSKNSATIKDEITTQKKEKYIRDL